MTESKFENYVCWNRQELSSIINIEALSIETSVFLATHVPFKKISYVDTPQHIPDTSEEQLLRDLLGRAENDEHTFLVVQGMAGSGKSHLIRWLSERYKAISSLRDSEVMMLIERANSSLRQTLIQITKHELFDSTRFSEQIGRIEKATKQLSDDSLADTLIHWLRIGSKEVTDIDIAMDKVSRHRKRVDPYIADFLLNPKVREHLKRKGGPIERLMKHLSSGIHVYELDSENNPIFEAEDFEFEPLQLREIREGGYEATQSLAEYLNRKKDGREYTTRYLNALIGYAVQQTTQISVDDLKALFNELRKELKAQGKSLVLMVEDISVFTGLDAGLIDVMVTQHTGGETQKTLCRMTSVVGVTDGYFRDSLPPNIKQRIKHHITLNADTSNRSDTTHLFNEVSEMEIFVSKYLNLLRMPPSDFERWSAEGGEPVNLPNACIGCEFREKCHSAFGEVELDDSNDNRDVGLYPFNKNLLNVIATKLDTDKRSKTPRTLLELLEFFLGHSDAIENGDFPVANLLPYVSAPGFDHYTQIEAVSKKDADRLERFMMFWGDRSVDIEMRDGIKHIGGIPTIAYEAFQLPFISGNAKLTPVSKPTLQPKLPKPPDPPEDLKDKLFDDIHQWRRGEGKLKHHAVIKRIWNRLLKTRIDWDVHHVTHAQLDDFQPQRLAIEDQFSRAKGAYLYFERSNKLALFFEALTQVDKYASRLSIEKLGNYLLILDDWLTANEATIVQFVKTPYKRDDGPPQLDMPLAQVLLENNIYFAMLGGDLRPSQDTGSHLITSLARQTEQFNDIWDKPSSLINQEYRRSETWTNAIKWGAGARRLQDNREHFLQMLNRPQGESRKEAKFIDAPYFLELLNAFNKRKWAIDTRLKIEIDRPDYIYQKWLKVYLYLQAYGNTILSDEESHVTNTVTMASKWIGQHSPEEVFDTIDKTLKALTGRPYGSFKKAEDLSYKKLQILLGKLKDVQAKETLKKKILSYSSVDDTVRTVWDYIYYFEQYGLLVNKQLVKVNEDLLYVDGSGTGADPGIKVDEEYQELLKTLASVLEIVASEKAVLA